jgi:hypothetical protein
MGMCRGKLIKQSNRSLALLNDFIIDSKYIKFDLAKRMIKVTQSLFISGTNPENGIYRTYGFKDPAVTRKQRHRGMLTSGRFCFKKSILKTIRSGLISSFLLFFSLVMSLCKVHTVVTSFFDEFCLLNVF